MKKRLDLRLVEKGLAPSRTKAQDLIKAGAIWIFEDSKWSQAWQASALVSADSPLEIRSDLVHRFVSRGGWKLQGALQELKISVQGLPVLDVGQSTGGFTDCLLQNGARQVVGVDVGHSQLDPRLRADPRVICLEKVNARGLQQNASVKAHQPQEGWPLIVGDLSFISLTLVLPSLAAVLAAGGQILALVKPQFEVGPENLAKGGVVQDSRLFDEVEARIRQKCLELKLTVRHYLNSSLEGKDGNREFFIWAQKD